jgi:hypothetical protein
MEKREEGWVHRVLTPAEDDAGSFSPEEGHWAASGEVLNEHDRLWMQYVVLVDLYKFYLEVAWKVSVWYYATTGVVLAYFFEHIGDQGSEALPLLLIFLSGASAGFAYLHWRGARHLHSMIQLLEYIAESLHLPGRPHIEFAAAFLLINCFMFAAVCVASLVLFLSVAQDLQLT